MKRKVILFLTAVLLGTLSFFSACESESAKLPLEPEQPSLKEEEPSPKEEQPAHVHSYVTSRETPADCLHDGERVLVCSCGDEKIEVLTALGHDFRALASDDSTCVRQGYTERKCTRCEEVEHVDLPLSEHDWGEWKVLVEPTCTEEGLKAVECRVCHLHREEEAIPASGHEMEERVLLDPTCTEEGVLEERCTRCELSKTRPIPKISHSWGDISVIREATCTEEGLRSAVCALCGLHEKEQVIPARGHDHSIVLSRREPDCTHDGAVETKCSRCEDKIREVLPATGHKRGETKVLEEATCSREGKKVSTCSVCGEKMAEESIPKTPHTFGAYQDDALPTCDKEGERSRQCEVCGALEKQTIPARGHDFDQNFTVDKIPTRTEEGLKSRHCKNCAESTEKTTIARLGESTEYSVSLRTSLGDAIGSGEPKIEFYSEGQCVGTAKGLNAKSTLPTKRYKVHLSELPAGYSSPKGSYELEPYPAELTIHLAAALIGEDAPLETKYAIGSVFHDRKITLLGSSEEADRETTFGALLSQYKAIFLNMYFCDCGACVWEMPNFVNAYNAKLSSGKCYGEEVACVMLDSGYEKGERIRNFIKRTNTYYPSYSGAENIPMMVIHDRWLSAFFTRRMVSAFPTSILIDCEGVIVESHRGSMYESGFKQMMQRGIDRYEAIRAWRIEEGLEVKELEPPRTIAPVLDLPSGRKRSDP